MENVHQATSVERHVSRRRLRHRPCAMALEVGLLAPASSLLRVLGARLPTRTRRNRHQLPVGDACALRQPMARGRTAAPAGQDGTVSGTDRASGLDDRAEAAAEAVP